MSRPSNELTEVIKVRITEEEREKLSEEAEERGINLSDIVRERISFVPQNSEKEDSFVPQNMYEEELTRLSERLGINEYKLLEVVDYLISSGKLYRSETGKLKMKGLNADAEYISVDEAIDNMDAPEWKKKSFKEIILKNLDINRFDDTGNGGGL